MGDSRARALAPSSRAAVCAAAATLLVATCPSAARAADVSMQGTAPDLQMTYTALPGESNWVTVQISGGRILLQQTGPATPLTLSAMGDCILDDTSEPKSLSCARTGVSRLAVTLGGGDDGAKNTSTLPARIFGADGTDTLDGGDEDEQLEGGPGPDTINGGGGNDVVLGATSQDPSAGADSDRLAGGPGDDDLFGGGGADTEDGGLGNDDLIGGAGDDTLDAGPGSSLGDADTISGNDGLDTVSYVARMTGVQVTKNGLADDGALTERDNVGLDVERVIGGLASDMLSGGPGADELQGGPGDDTLSGGPGADHLLGGPGRDLVAYSAERDVTVSLDDGSARTRGEIDEIDEVEDVLGGRWDDTVTGSTVKNALMGGTGHDYLDGRRGEDRLGAGRSADVVVARDGVRYERVSCGRGKDLAIVNRGDDVVQRGADRCEQVDDGSQITPRPGWVYVDPRCGAGARLDLPAMHRFVPLRYSILLASGYRNRRSPTLDTSDCPIRMKAATGRHRSASLDVRGAPVTLGQTLRRRVTTELGIERLRCAGAAERSATAAANRRRLRVKKRRRRGRVHVEGRYSSGGSEGTDWTTTERCSSTTTRVHEGRVSVYDRVKRKTIIVRAGETYVARRRP
jgi:Ca2+-binding RTX toxin-like protein